jgi:hypothetical protein
MCRALRNVIWVPQWPQRPGGSADATIQAVRQSGQPNIPGVRTVLEELPPSPLQSTSLTRSGWDIIVMIASSSRFIEDASVLRPYFFRGSFRKLPVFSEMLF